MHTSTMRACVPTPPARIAAHLHSCEGEATKDRVPSTHTTHTCSHPANTPAAYIALPRPRPRPKQTRLAVPIALTTGFQVTHQRGAGTRTRTNSVDRMLLHAPSQEEDSTPSRETPSARQAPPHCP
eukprot:6185082-Pleurochrysis_carterae.AAC.1